MPGRLDDRRPLRRRREGAVVHLNETAADGVPRPVRGLSVSLEHFDHARRGHREYTPPHMAAW